MNVPINCPICGDPLINTFNTTTNQVVYKNCRLRHDHIFSCAVFLDYFMDTENYGIKDRIERAVFTLSISPPLSIVIFPYVGVMDISKSLPNKEAVISNTKRLLFYIEPDFSDYKKLVNKLKIYILFS